MKQRQLIFYGVLVLAMFVLVACVQPGEAVRRPAKPTQEVVAVTEEPVTEAPLCARAGQSCTLGSGCCAGLTCTGFGKLATCVAPTCTPLTVCSGSYLNTTFSNCTKTSTFCQYGCNSSANVCNPPPGCTPSYICYSGTNVSGYTNSSCQTINTSCQYGCNFGTGQCNTCTPTCFDSDGGLNLSVTGNTTGVTSDCNNFFVYDLCWAGNGGPTVYERVCPGGPYTGQIVQCPSGQTCQNGHCQ